MRVHSKLLNKKSFTRLEKHLLNPAWWRQFILFLEKPVQRRCCKYPCQTILYRGAFLKCLWMWRNRFWLKSMLPLCSPFSSRSQQMEVHVLGCLSSWDTLIQVTLKRNYCSAVHLKPQQKLMMSWKTIKIKNYVKTQALNTRLYKELCKVMNTDHEVLFFYIGVRCFSKGCLINRVFEMKD